MIYWSIIVKYSRIKLHQFDGILELYYIKELTKELTG